MKTNPYSTKPVKSILKKTYLAIFLCGLFFNPSLFAQLPTAQQIASRMKVGWNLGNTLEAIGGETAWGNPKTTQRLIDSVKAAGFNSIRLPVAWFDHSDTNTCEINADWIARVKEVVDYCINDSLYVIINIHWDHGWLENRVNSANQNKVNERQNAYWTQIANYFKNYDEHLLFAGANEPNVDNAAGMAILLSYHQTFIDAVRATGGNNSSRTLIIQGPSTDIEKTNKLMNTMPTDRIADRLMVEVHYYSPYQFCLMTEDASWGKMFYYWGSGYHSAKETSRNATWGEETYLNESLELMKTKFVDQGFPVIIGEYGVIKRTLPANSDQALHIASREYYYKYFVKSAVSRGIIPFNWDTGPYWTNAMGIFDRQTGATVDRGLLDAIMEGVELGNSTDIFDDSMLDSPDKFRLDQNYPNPFNLSTQISYQLPTSTFAVLKVFDIKGKELRTLVNERQSQGNHSVTFDATDLSSGVYLYRLETPIGISTQKLLLLK
ncbi:MAG TPA: cellulase family glycosylhydrolase [Candidatus Marinimicrobia bacterium]|nr:cellulase family glycosylhydrolase [Candidatus Neomarinimicrobiota bacterium]HRS51717.1 cellulase family glycosylhydrolase [Candidatus Neomarinimicrobiota bacterium]HRU92133.1 cellulase family glycosylhydrolase [Candidatus Neomarinimicrobiota bacterium]